MFKLHSEYEPAGDQPKAIEYLTKGIEKGEKFQTLLGVTGSRKNLYNGKYNTKCAETNTCACPQQDFSPDNSTQSLRSSSLRMQ